MPRSRTNRGRVGGDQRHPSREAYGWGCRKALCIEPALRAAFFQFGSRQGKTVATADRLSILESCRWNEGVCTMLGWVKRKFASFGIEVSRGATLHRFLNTRHIDLIVDAGANLGQFGTAVRERGYTGRIHSFEPVLHVYSALQSLVENDAKWQVSNLALGDHPGAATINVYDNHTLTSLLTGSHLIENYNTMGATKTEVVNVDTLDHQLEGDSAQDIFLKIDVQGFERQVLDGARQSLSRVVALYVEVPIEQLYEESWTFLEAISYMDNIGFVPAQFRTVSALPDDPASAIEFDCLFRRKVYKPKS